MLAAAEWLQYRLQENTTYQFEAGCTVAFYKYSTPVGFQQLLQKRLTAQGNSPCLIYLNLSLVYNKRNICLCRYDEYLNVSTYFPDTLVKKVNTCYIDSKVFKSLRASGCGCFQLVSGAGGNVLFLTAGWRVTSESPF